MKKISVHRHKTTPSKGKGWWRRFLEKLAESNRKSIQNGCRT